jgi:hypothetical protein
VHDELHEARDSSADRGGAGEPHETYRVGAIVVTALCRCGAVRLETAPRSIAWTSREELAQRTLRAGLHFAAGAMSAEDVDPTAALLEAAATKIAHLRALLAVAEAEIARLRSE